MTEIWNSTVRNESAAGRRYNTRTTAAWRLNERQKKKYYHIARTQEKKRKIGARCSVLGEPEAKDTITPFQARGVRSVIGQFRNQFLHWNPSFSIRKTGTGTFEKKKKYFRILSVLITEHFVAIGFCFNQTNPMCRLFSIEIFFFDICNLRICGIFNSTWSHYPTVGDFYLRIVQTRLEGRTTIMGSSKATCRLHDQGDRCKCHHIRSWLGEHWHSAQTHSEFAVCPHVEPFAHSWFIYFILMYSYIFKFE